MLPATFCSLPGHVFWPNSISVPDDRHIDCKRLLAHGEVTDSYLVALAQAHRGRPASFDRRLVTAAVHEGTQPLQLI